MPRAKWSRRKFTPVRMPKEQDLRRWRFGLPAQESELDNNLTIETARGAIHGRIPRTRGYIRKSSVPLIENNRVRQDLTDPTTHREQLQLLDDPVFQNTLQHLSAVREAQQRPDTNVVTLSNRLTNLLTPRNRGNPVRPDRNSDPMGMAYSNRVDPADVRPPQRKRMRELYPSGTGTKPAGVTVKEYFDINVARRRLERFMSRLRSRPDVYEDIRRGDRSRYDKLFKIEDPEE